MLTRLTGLELGLTPNPICNPNPNPNPKPNPKTNPSPNPNPNTNPNQVTLNGLTGLKPAVSTDAGLKVQRPTATTLTPDPDPDPSPNSNPTPKPTGPGDILQHLAHHQRRRLAAHLHRGGGCRSGLELEHRDHQRRRA